MVKISIICLIYKSIELMDAVYKSAWKYTPMLRNGEAEFLFVANDATDQVIAHLEEKKYNYIINENKHFSEDELFQMGYGIPEYMNRVYKGYNQGILHAKGERIVLINSDNFFSPDWLENLLKYSTFKNVVTSQLVERRHEKFGVFPGAIEKYFGDCIENFNEDDFVKFSFEVRKTGLKQNGAYMPALMWRDIALYAGLYPEGNIAGETKEQIVRFGDEYFYDKLKEMGIEHYTSLDSIVYHLKEGERESNNSAKYDSLSFDPSNKKVTSYAKLPVKKYKSENLRVNLSPTIVHENIINNLLNKEANSDDIPQKVVCKSICPFIYEKTKLGNRRIIKLFNIIKISYKKSVK